MLSNTNILEYSYTLKQLQRKNVLFMIIFVAVVFIICTAWIFAVLFPASVHSDSMIPTLHSGDVVFITPLAVPKSAAYTDIPVVTSLLHSIPVNRGDLVYIKPQYELEFSLIERTIDVVVRFITFQRISPFSYSKMMTETASIRRVVGMPGDVISMRDYMLYITEPGKSYALTEFELSELQYNIIITQTPENWDIKTGFSGVIDRFVLGENEYFVLADNRSVASDSRLWGVISADRIGGKVIARYWPFSSISLF